MLTNDVFISNCAVYHLGKFYGVLSTERLIKHIFHLRNTELEKAGIIQEKMTGSGIYDEQGLFVDVKLKMAHNVGGDFYHVKKLSKDLCLISCFDVSGKDVSAAFKKTECGLIKNALQNKGIVLVLPAPFFGTLLRKEIQKGMIAVDPKIIPLGAKVEIKDLGTFIAEDTGSKIKGNRIDIYFETKEEARKFGRQVIWVRILDNNNIELAELLYD